jgi:P-type Cu2+ transporter
MPEASSVLPWEHRGPLQVEDDFAVLDDAVEQGEFTRPSAVATPDGAQALESVLVVQGMYCAACADTVESALANQPGVLHAEVQAATRRLTLRWDPARTPLSALARRVGAYGYRLLPAQQALGATERLAETRKALWRLFVAGFCMMQVMMYAWPSYVTQPGDIPADIDQLLRWAIWVLSLPVVLFASGPFFESAWRDLRHGRVGMDTPVSVGILVTFVASSAATFDPTGPFGHEVWFDSLTMFVFFLLGGRYLEFKARDRTAGALDALMNRLPEACERLREDGSTETVSIRRLVLGDRVRVQAGQAFPGDGWVESAGATVDEALLTGESHPVTRVRGDTVVAGSFNLAGPVTIRLQRLGRDTRFAQIVALMEQASTEKPRLARLADRIAGPFLVLVLLAAAGAAWYWWQIDPQRALSVAVAVLIVTCPCALALATPTAMLASAGTLAGRGVLARRLQAFESLAGVDTVVFDKTGTLTRDRVQLEQVLVRPGMSAEAALALARPLSDASLHPVSRAISAQSAPTSPPTPNATPPGSVLPDAGWHMEEVAGQGVHAWLAERWLKLGAARFCGLDEAELLAQGRSVPDQPCAFLVNETGWLATFVLEEGLREGAADAVAQLHALGLQTRLLSGDREAAARRVAQQLGITEVKAQASPEQKLQEVVRLQDAGARIAMVGDGLNDGPVLARAHCSFALGSGAPLSQAQSDFVVQSGRLQDIVQTVKQARRTMQIVKQNLLWAAGYNAVSVPLALLGYMPPWAAGLGMAGSSLLVIGNAMRLGHRPPHAVPLPQTQSPPLQSESVSTPP